MTQKNQNSQKAQKMAMEVLDQVNGGFFHRKHILAVGC